MLRKHYSHCRTATISVTACLPALIDLAVYNQINATAVPGSVLSHRYVNEAAAVRCPKVWLSLGHRIPHASWPGLNFHATHTQKISCLQAVDPATFPVLLRFCVSPSTLPFTSWKTNNFSGDNPGTFAVYFH